MNDPSGTDSRLIEEISALRKRIEELEQSEIERTLVAEDLILSRNRLSRAEIISRCGNWEFDLGSKKVFASEGARRIYGLVDREWTIQEIQRMVLPEYRPMLDDALRGLIDENRPYNVEFKIQRPDTGEIIDIHSVAEYDRRRNVVFGVIQDISDRKRAEEALGSIQARYRFLFEHAPDGIVIIDPVTARFVEFNEAAHRQLGYSREEFAGLSIPDFEVVESPEETMMHIKNVMREGRDDFETKHRTRQGEIRNIHVTAQMTEIFGHTVYHCVWRDITTRKRAEEALREREKTLKAFFDAVHETLILINTEGTVILCNPVVAQRLGKTVGELTGTYLYDHFPPEVARRRKEHYDKVIATGEPVHFDTERAGRTFEEYCYPIFEEGGKVSGATIFAQEITERKRSMEALRESEERYRTVVEHSRDGITIIGKGVCIYVNQRFLDMFGFDSAEEVIGRTHSVMVHPDDLERAIDINRAGEAGDMVPSTYEFKGVKKDGSTIFVDASATRITYKGDYGSLVFLRDITDRKRAEDALRKSEQTLHTERDKLRTLLDNAPFAMVLTDKEDCFTYINPKFTESFGFDLFDVPDGRTWFRKAFPDAELRHTVISAWKEDSRSGTRKPRVFVVTSKDGKEKVVNFMTSILASGDYLTACEDITELKHLESQLRQSQKMEAIGTLTGGIAHDFNNILTVITGFGTLLQMSMEESNPLRAYVEQILAGSQKAAQLTQTLMIFSRQQPIVLKSLDVNDFVRGAEKLLKRLLTEDVIIRTILAPGDIVVMADAAQLDQIMFNLATNARDAMPHGGVLTIETKVADLDEEFQRYHGYGSPGAYALLSISDTGVGMDEVTKEKIFDPFFTTKEVGKGTGLGLSSVYGTVKQHKGYITVYSEPTVGTTFHIYLPVAGKEVDKEEPVPAPPKGGNETILVAEDNEVLRGLICKILTEYGYTTVEAKDGSEAVERYKKADKIDLLILDSIMPVKNGREAYNEIHALNPDIKVLFMSGYTRDVILDKGVEDKKFAFFSKPILPKALLQKVREVLDTQDS